MTTGRRRRCGWFDAVIARYATRVNGITDYFLTKLDVLSSLETVPICVGYTVNGKRTDDMPMTQSEIARRGADLRGDCRAGGRTSPGHVSSTTCPPRPATTCCGWKSLPEPMFRASASDPAGIRRSCAATSWPARDATDDPRLVDPDYDRHGGFPNFEAAQPGPGFGRFLTAMRRAQDLAVSADPDSDTWSEAADRAERAGEAARPVRGGRGRRAGQPGA